VELIQMYWNRVWNDREVELIREICADPIIRHDAKSVTYLSHDEQIARVRHQSEARQPFFMHEVLHGDAEFVTSVWNMYTRKGGRIELSGIEIFRAENGRFTDCWNSTYTEGFWGREGDPSVPENLPPPEILASLDGITREWVQKVFKAAGVKAQRVSMVSTERVGHGNMSETARVYVSYNAAPDESPNTIICKFDPKIPQAAAMAAAVGSNLREVETYRFFDATPPVRLPRAYLAEHAHNGATLNLVLEDLTATSRPGDQIGGCSQADAALVVAELGKLHAAYWKNADVAALPWLMDRKAGGEMLGDTYARGAEIFHERFERRLSKEAFEIIDAFVPLVAKFGLAVRPHTTLLHGEIRVDNVMFETPKDGAPRACLIDWQFTTFGDPHYDIAYFLTGSLTPEDRRACENALIEAHHRQIAAVDASYTLEDARAAYRFNTLAGLQSTVGAATAMPAGEHSDALLMTLAERNTAAARDWGTLEVLRAL
jgi:hypothetical protein